MLFVNKLTASFSSSYISYTAKTRCQIAIGNSLLQLEPCGRLEEGESFDDSGKGGGALTMAKGVTSVTITVKE